uniref:Fungal lipase-like domain-containing protein n=1 Tax=Panagrolaimus sp. ES5 TaxID=591445 RepID=A0AC34G9U2_9BILA
MASLAATTIATSKLFDPNKIKLVSFGQPRTGDDNYAALVDSTIPYVFRVVHKADIVPAYPLNVSIIYDYSHHKSEVWFNNEMSVEDSWIECDEDDSWECSRSVRPHHIEDHFYYFGVTIGMANSSCKKRNPYI